MIKRKYLYEETRLEREKYLYLEKGGTEEGWKEVLEAKKMAVEKYLEKMKNKEIKTMYDLPPDLINDLPFK